MEREVRYCTSEDGVRIAYTVEGEGPPLVFMPGIYSHLSRMPEWDSIAQFFARLASRFRLVRYDGRGTGLSDHDVADLSILGRARDLSAVADGLRLRSFTLFAWDGLAPAAFVYAHGNSRRVSKLIVFSGTARSSADPEQTKAFGDLLRASPHFGYRAMVLYTDPSVSKELADEIATAYEGVASLDYTLRTFAEMASGIDVTALLPTLRMPALVMHRERCLLPFEAGREIASLLPNSSFVPLPGDSANPWFGDTEPLFTAIEDFMSEHKEPTAKRKSATSSAFRTILFTDMEGSTTLTQRLGDARARELLREHERIVREALRELGGSEVKTMGDGFMASFSSTTKALECAIAIQRAFSERNEWAEEPMKVRVGLNAGEPIAEDDDLHGTAVIRAARIAALAQGGEILVANVVRELAEGKEFMFGDRGEIGLRGFDDPVRLYEVRWRE